MSYNSFLFKDECYDILGCCMTVHSELGCGFLEAVYQEALEYEFSRKSIPYEREAQIDINYKGIILDKKYYADFICHDKIILELKSVKAIEDVHIAQLMNYLRATGMPVGYLINFGATRLEYKRFVI
nr:GxxExxY protein [uncultured Marinifilum sp.]